jgi:hypothetical protein
MRKTTLTLAAMLLALQSTAHATPAFARLYKQQYGYMPSCNACHTEGGGSPLGGFGKAFKDAGKNLAAFAQIDKLDSDGDKATNGVEALAKANPNDKTSTPVSAGAWLDPSSLIPKELKALYPGVLTWVPKDATLSPADITNAKTMGATLSAADENTIYIPLANQRPMGFGIIFPVTHQGKSFFLLMTTEASKELKIGKLEVLNAKDVPAAKNSALYGKLIGTSALNAAADKGDALDAAIAQAVKNTAVLMFLRLKGA